MRASVTLFFAVLVALTAAYPHPQDEVNTDPSPSPVPATSLAIADPTLPIPQSTSLKIPVTIPSAFPTATAFLNTSSSSRHRNSHWEPIPIFSKSCDCPKLATVNYPCWATDALQVSCVEVDLRYFNGVAEKENTRLGDEKWRKLTRRNSDATLKSCTPSSAGLRRPTGACHLLARAETSSRPHLTGKHPCELGPNTGNPEPVLTVAPVVTAKPKKRWQDMTHNPAKYGVRK